MKNVYLQDSLVQTPNQIECEMVHMYYFVRFFFDSVFFVYHGIYSSARITQSCGENSKLRRLFQFPHIVLADDWWCYFFSDSPEKDEHEGKEKIETKSAFKRTVDWSICINALNCDCLIRTYIIFYSLSNERFQLHWSNILYIQLKLIKKKRRK